MVPRDCGGDRGTSVGSDSKDGRVSSGRVTESYVLFEKPLPAECSWTDVLINVTDLPTAIDAIWSAVIENDRKSRYSEEDKGEGEPGLATTLNLLKRSCQEIRIVKLELNLEVDPDSDDEKTWAARAPTAKKVAAEARRRLVVRWFMLYKLLDGTFMFGGQPQVDGRPSSATTTGRSCPVNSGKVVPTTVVQEGQESSSSERSPRPAADESSNISTDAVECTIIGASTTAKGPASERYLPQDLVTFYTVHDGIGILHELDHLPHITCSPITPYGTGSTYYVYPLVAICPLPRHRTLSAFGRVDGFSVATFSSKQRRDLVHC
ncbi:hypothetical protein FOZ63_031407 [Perkinsus olseni]|uniref:Uncharacterized protein n=1 Tax=Perkinsus olseni TaxID=32597 RepID=A0A7J6UM34_PEROL|nr:hypothetical protein FOZ63_031407 [Perkinsus olseni]